MTMLVVTTNSQHITFIIFIFRELQNIKKVQVIFRMKWFLKQPMCVPNILVFIKDTWEVQKPCFSLSPAGIKHSEELLEDQDEAHIRHALNALQIRYGTMWRVLRKRLSRMESLHLAQVVSLANIESRFDACNYWLTIQSRKIGSRESYKPIRDGLFYNTR